MIHNNGKTKRPPMSQAQRQALVAATGREIDWPELTSEQARRRKKLEGDTQKWLQHYFPGIYRQPFGDVHREIIDASEYTIKTGGRCVVAAPRGTGKSYVVDGVALKAVLTGKVRFPVVIPWDSKSLRKALSFWKKALCFNEHLAELYPEYCTPFRLSRGVAQKVGQYTRGGKPLGALLLVSEGMIVLPESRGVIGGATINGNPLGLHHTTDSGEGLRPDLIFIDDPQDRETSLSRQQIENTIDLIDFDISGMAGPDTAMPMLLACTVKAKDDVAEHYLNNNGWRAVRVPQIVSWPVGFDERESQTRKLWDEWNDIRVEGEAARDGGKAERAYYRKNKSAMVEGMAVSWKDRYVHKATPDMPKQPDAMYSAMADYFKMGHAAFMAERQNDPSVAKSGQYELTIDQILTHATDLPRLHLPERAQHLVGHADINRTGLHWCVTAFDQAMTAHVVAYGNWPPRGELWSQNATAQVRQASIYRGLSELMGQVAGADFRRGGAQVRPSLFLIDASYESETVHRFCESWRGPFRCMPAIGRAAHRYRWSKATLVGRPSEQAHVQRPQSRLCPYVMANVDHWREVAQRAWLAEVGEAGGCTIHAVSNPRAHVPFAEHVTAEKLAQKYETELGWRWEWTHAVGSNWDWGDALTGCWVAAALSGLNSSGMESQKVVRRKRPAIRMVQV